MAEQKTPSLFTIDFAVPPDVVTHPGRTWWTNQTVSVLAWTVERAIYCVRAAHPKAAIHAVNRRSRGEVIVDPEVQLISLSS